MRIGSRESSSLIPYLSLMFLMFAFGVSLVKDRVKVLEIAQVEMTAEIQGLRAEIEEIKTSLVVEEPEPVISYTDVMACSTTSTFKSYMDYRAITNKSSKQYALQQEAYTGADGLRYVNDRLMVAMAGRSVGDILDITLEDGTVLEAIVGDIKGNTKCSHSDGSILEFVVDTRVMDPYVKMMGNYNSVYSGVITNIRLYM